MNKFFFIFPLIIILALAAGGAKAAVKPQPALAGSMIKTEYFSVKIPKGWIMPTPVKKQPNNGLSAVFMLAEGDLAISLNIAPAGVDIPQYIAKMSADMKKQGLNASDPGKIDGFYRISITGPANGQGWFKEDNGLFSATMIFGKDMARAKELLTALKPVNMGLFPLAAN